MTTEISFGKVRIVDVNQNDQLDIGVDQILSDQGLPLPSRTLQRRLDGLLQDLQATNWKGVPLEQASRYLQSFRKAAEMARKGHVMAMEVALQSAIRFSNHLPVVFNGKRAEDIRKMGLQKGVQFRFQQIDQEIQTTGSISTVKMLLNLAKEYSDDLQQNFQINGGYTPQKADQILKRAYQKGIPIFYQRIDHKAARGELLTTKGLLHELSFYLADAKKDFGLDLARSPKLDEQALKLAYRQGIPREYVLAEDEALEGEIEMVEIRLERLKVFIQEADDQFKIKIPFNNLKALQILRLGFEAAMNKNMDHALAQALQKKPFETKEFLGTALVLANRFNRKYGGKKSGNPLNFDLNRADQIRDCSQGLAPCPAP